MQPDAGGHGTGLDGRDRGLVRIGRGAGLGRNGGPLADGAGISGHRDGGVDDVGAEHDADHDHRGQDGGAHAGGPGRLRQRHRRSGRRTPPGGGRARHGTCGSAPAWNGSRCGNGSAPAWNGSRCGNGTAQGRRGSRRGNGSTPGSRCRCRCGGRCAPGGNGSAPRSRRRGTQGRRHWFRRRCGGRFGDRIGCAGACRCALLPLEGRIGHPRLQVIGGEVIAARPAPRRIGPGRRRPRATGSPSRPAFCQIEWPSGGSVGRPGELVAPREPEPASPAIARHRDPPLQNPQVLLWLAFGPAAPSIAVTTLQMAGTRGRFTLVALSRPRRRAGECSPGWNVGIPGPMGRGSRDRPTRAGFHRARTA